MQSIYGVVSAPKRYFNKAAMQLCLLRSQFGKEFTSEHLLWEYLRGMLLFADALLFLLFI